MFGQRSQRKSVSLKVRRIPAGKGYDLQQPNEKLTLLFSLMILTYTLDVSCYEVNAEVDSVREAGVGNIQPSGRSLCVIITNLP